MLVKPKTSAAQAACLNELVVVMSGAPRTYPGTVNGHSRYVGVFARWLPLCISHGAGGDGARPEQVLCEKRFACCWPLR